MHPILWQGYGFIIPAWHFFYLLAALAALFFLFFLRRSFSDEISASILKALYSWAYIGGYAGARLGSLLIEQRETLTTLGDFFTAFFSFGAMNFYGGLLGASLCGGLYAGAQRENTRLSRLADLAFPSGFLALGIGRIGCFLNGDDYGLAITWERGEPLPWWAVLFPGEQVARLPVQLWESAAALCLVLCSLKLFKLGYAEKRPGLIAGFCLSGYAVCRFGLEFFRADPRGSFFYSWLSPAQWLSIGVVLMVGGIALSGGRREPS